MVTKEVKGHKIVFYDSVEDLPITQFHKYGKYTLVESGIGDSIQDIDRHITRIINFLGDTKKAYQELLNLRQSLYMVMNEQDIHNKATLCLVKSVDGKDWEDFSEGGISELYELVNGATQKELDTIISELRKKIDIELRVYFPKVFSDVAQKNIADLLRKRAMLQIATIVNGEDNQEKIDKITKDIYEIQNTKSFEGAESEEIKFDKQFEDMCLTMAREFGSGIKKYTTMEFYTAYEKLIKESEQIKKLNRRKK